jgi:hypothetical protein
MSEILREAIDFASVENEILEESDNGKSVKQYFIKGPFLQAEVKNGNSRIYPLSILEREVLSINESKIKNNRCIGELGHPPTIEINLDRVSHLIKELKMEGNYGIGKALMVDTPMGKIGKSLIDAGVKLGVSTRGVGTLKNQIVQNDYRLITVDVVSDPSAPDAWMEAVFESNREWVIENGILTEKELKQVIVNADKIVVEHKFTKEEKAAAFIKLFTETMNTIKGKHIKS